VTTWQCTLCGERCHGEDGEEPEWVKTHVHEGPAALAQPYIIKVEE